ncbi:hypothetical protein [Succinivibrio dextrinosolvens]|uniref:hypothetical protein n=1 Tax=Succinivibrio dextrinosolvens TaxID=83771 RepID=UPI00241FCA2D|nr:hypothetical protein [Succinivibrio dextrinosolvens]MBE6422620.1 hypothetical protein [Succinivibrio dextrinosolvens]
MNEVDLMYYMKNVILSSLLSSNDNPQLYQQLLADPVNYIKSYWGTYLQTAIDNFEEEYPNEDPDLEDYCPNDNFYYMLGQEISKEAVVMFKALRRGECVEIQSQPELKLKPKPEAREKLKNMSMLKTTFIREQEVSGSKYFRGRKINE